MDLETLIRSILYQKKSVSVPFLGTFAIVTKPARLIQEEQVTFVPPQSFVTYSAQCDESDNTLQQHYAKCANISEAEALAEIAQFSNAILTEIETQGTLYLNGIGTLTQSKEFTSTTYGGISPENFALPTFVLDTCSDAESKRAKSRPLNIAKTAGKALFISSPIVFGALLIPNILQISHNAQLASLFRDTKVTMNFNQPEVPRPYEYKAIAEIAQATPVETTETEKISKPVKKVSKAKKEQVKTAKVTKQKKQKRNATPKAVPVDNNAKYFIIVGTFSVKSNAENYSEKLKDKDFKSGVISDNDKNRVYLSAFADKAEAQQYINELHNSSEYNNAWLYVKQS
ncbi:MAG: SPOR domain-containing protein [Bacteroidales bacterium]|nr:SPOR domain-containing protein [Bacteroidales bacterium]